MKSESNTLAHTISFRAIFLDFKETLKRGWQFVLFSCRSFVLIKKLSFQWSVLIMLAIGGYCMVGASNAFNQVIEKI
jgi:protoheme IX farnesyltransferase